MVLDFIIFPPAQLAVRSTHNRIFLIIKRNGVKYVSLLSFEFCFQYNLEKYVYAVMDVLLTSLLLYFYLQNGQSIIQLNECAWTCLLRAMLHCVASPGSPP